MAAARNMAPRVARLEVLRDVLRRADETFARHARGVDGESVIPLEELPGYVTGRAFTGASQHHVCRQRPY